MVPVAEWAGHVVVDDASSSSYVFPDNEKECDTYICILKEGVESTTHSHQTCPITGAFSEYKLRNY